MGYREHQPSICPPWLRGPVGEAWHGEFGGAKDGVATSAREAVKARFPSGAPADALPSIGSDRLLEQGTSETATAFRVRLADAWTAWLGAGGPLSMLNQLAALGYTSTNGNPVLVQQNGRAYTRSAGGALVTTQLAPNPSVSGSPSWWTFDSDSAWWTRFALLFPSLPTGWTTVTQPPVVAPTDDVVEQIRRIVRRWKPAKAKCEGIYVLTSGRFYGWPVSQTWGAGTGNWGGSTVVYWTV